MLGKIKGRRRRGWQRTKWLDLNRDEFKQAPGGGEGQGSLTCFTPRGCKELDKTEWLNNRNLNDPRAESPLVKQLTWKENNPIHQKIIGLKFNEHIYAHQSKIQCPTNRKLTEASQSLQPPESWRKPPDRRKKNHNPLAGMKITSQKVQFSSVTQLCSALCEPKDCSMPGLPVHHQFLEFIQTYVHWVSDAISSSIVPFFSHFQSSSASESFRMSQFFTSGDQSIGVSDSASVLPMNIQDWFPLGWTGWIC